MQKKILVVLAIALFIAGFITIPLGKSGVPNEFAGLSSLPIGSKSGTSNEVAGLSTIPVGSKSGASNKVARIVGGLLAANDQSEQVAGLVSDDLSHDGAAQIAGIILGPLG